MNCFELKLQDLEKLRSTLVLFVSVLFAEYGSSIITCPGLLYDVLVVALFNRRRSQQDQPTRHRKTGAR